MRHLTGLTTAPRKLGIVAQRTVGNSTCSPLQEHKVFAPFLRSIETLQYVNVPTAFLTGVTRYSLSILSSHDSSESHEYCNRHTLPLKFVRTFYEDSHTPSRYVSNKNPYKHRATSSRSKARSRVPKPFRRASNLVSEMILLKNISWSTWIGTIARTQASSPHLRIKASSHRSY